MCTTHYRTLSIGGAHSTQTAPTPGAIQFSTEEKEEDASGNEMEEQGEQDRSLLEDEGWMEIMDSDSEADGNEDETVKEKSKEKTDPAAKREVYAQLHDAGLMTRPAGCCVGVHVASRVWRAKTPSTLCKSVGT